MLGDLGRFMKSLSYAERALLAVGVFAVGFAVSLAAILVVLVRLPATYFHADHVSPFAEQHPAIRWAGVIIKNLLGAVLIVLGFVLSLPGIPGQGLLTILIGVMLVDFPGKRRFERRLVAQPTLLAAINALRARFGKPALVLTDAGAAATECVAEQQERRVSPERGGALQDARRTDS